MFCGDTLHGFIYLNMSSPVLLFLSVFFFFFFFFSPCRYAASCQAYFCCLLSLRWSPRPEHFICISNGRKQTDVIYITANSVWMFLWLRMAEPCQRIHFTTTDWCYPTCAVSRVVHRCSDVHRRTWACTMRVIDYLWFNWINPSDTSTCACGWGLYFKY